MANFTDVNSPPRSVRSTRSFFPDSASPRLEQLDHRRRLVLAGDESQPHVPAAVINQEKVPTPTVRGRRDWPTQIAVDDL
jgi:hypothetical protein